MSAPSEIGALIASRLRDVADFPEPGIGFKDITPLLADPDAFAAVVDALAATAGELDDIDIVAGIEARGFVIAGALGVALGRGVVLVRKAGKLPPPTLRRSYDLEYGSAELEVATHVLEGKRVLIVDDVLATGGTMRAAADLITEAGGTVAGLAVLLELGFLDGRSALAGLPALTALLTV